MDHFMHWRYESNSQAKSSPNSIHFTTYPRLIWLPCRNPDQWSVPPRSDKFFGFIFSLSFHFNILPTLDFLYQYSTQPIVSSPSRPEIIFHRMSDPHSDSTRTGRLRLQSLLFFFLQFSGSTSCSCCLPSLTSSCGHRSSSPAISSNYSRSQLKLKINHNSDSEFQASLNSNLKPFSN